MEQEGAPVVEGIDCLVVGPEEKPRPISVQERHSVSDRDSTRSRAQLTWHFSLLAQSTIKKERSPLVLPETIKFLEDVLAMSRGFLWH